jgi:N-acetylmuramoyl-L-alanine amidase
MSVFRQSGFEGGRRLIAAAAGAVLLLTAQVAMGGSRTETSAWETAVLARQVFEARPQGTHTRADYSRVMDGFRAIYHGNPGDAHAARAVEQVAELLAEEGREFNETKSLRDAAGQDEFLAKAYPGGSLAAKALGDALELLGPGAADDAAEARTVREQLLNDYPRSVEAREARAARADTDVAQEDTSRRRSSKHVEEARAQRAAVTPSDSRDASDEVSGVDDTHPASAKVDATYTRPGKMAMVTGIRHWSTPSYTRVAIDLGDSVEYEAAKVENPDRIYFDLHHARLAPQLAGKSFAVTDNGFLTRIRAAQFSGDVTRVVLDVHQVAEYSAFLLPNPYRLIIDIHGKQEAGSRKQEAENTAAGGSSAGSVRPSAGGGSEAQPENEAGAAKVGGAAGARQAGKPSREQGTEVSSLPPMPVTDGSAEFGLPSRDDSSGSAVAPPRVIIPSKPTASRPVPNSVATRSSDTGVEVAAVSEQPGRVEATRRPTSQPIAERSSSARTSRRGKKAHVEGEPAEPPPPTADGDATLMRALGLKIGRIVIDAGHGGHDSGTLGVGGIEEKDVVLDVALRLGKLLHDRLGADIVYTRADDTFIPLETRTAIANKAQADLFISVHANSSQDESARGVEVYYLNFTSDPDAMQVASRENAVSTQSVHELSALVKKIALKDKIDESRELAEDVDQSLYAGLEKGQPGLKNRGVKKAPFVVLIGANMPSILAEISFVTNPTDAEELRRPQYRERVAESLYRGIAQYARTINGSKSQEPTERAAVTADR